MMKEKGTPKKMRFVPVGSPSNPPVKTMFGGLDLSAIAKAAEYISRSHAGQAGEAIPPPTQPESLAQISLSTISTATVIDSFLKMKKNKRLKPASLDTYQKRLEHFNRQFEFLPLDPETIEEYLSQFIGETGRNRLNQQDLLTIFYEHAVRRLGLAKNPLRELERPLISHKQIQVLTLDQVRSLLKTPETPHEKVALDLLVGHGWRQVEVRRILVADVNKIRNNLIFCRGKQRDEDAPILPETADRLRALAAGRPNEEHIFLAEQTRHGTRAPLGEDGMADLITRLFERAQITGFIRHDLRRTFASMINSAGADEYLAMRLLRDNVPMLHRVYISYDIQRLVEGLKKYSPLRQLEEGNASLPAETSPKQPLSDNNGTIPVADSKEKISIPEPPKIVLNTKDSPDSETGVESAFPKAPTLEPKTEGNLDKLTLKTTKMVQNNIDSPVSETGESIEKTLSEREKGLVETGEG